VSDAVSRDDAPKAPSYVVVRPFTCAAGVFGPGDKVYEPWLNGQGPNLVAAGLLSPTHQDEDVPDNDLAGVADWNVHAEPAAEKPLGPPPGTLTLADALRYVHQNLGEVSVEERRDLIERLLADPDAIEEQRSDSVRVHQVADGGRVVDDLPETLTGADVGVLHVADVVATARAHPDRLGDLLTAEANGKNRVTVLAMLHVLATEQAAAQLVPSALDADNEALADAATFPPPAADDQTAEEKAKAAPKAKAKAAAPETSKPAPLTSQNLAHVDQIVKPAK
jgi:hypothetical protein